jgi:hypothetical protein
LRFTVLARSRFNADVARLRLHQQVLQRAPIVDGMAHFADKVFGNIHRESASAMPAVKNMARMLLAGQTGRAVRMSTPAAAKAQRAEHRRPQAGHLVLDPANDIRRRFVFARISSDMCQDTYQSASKLAAKNARSADSTVLFGLSRQKLD